MRFHRMAIAALSFAFVVAARGQELSAFKEMPSPKIKWQVDLEYSSGPVALTAKHVLVGAAVTDTNPLVRRLLCLSRDGKEIWHADHPLLEDIRSDWRGNGFHVKPTIRGDRIFYYSNRAEVICADLEGFRDGENDGPFTDETLHGAQDVDIVWKVDLIAENQIYKRDVGNMGNPLPTIVLDDKLAYFNTMHAEEWLYERRPKNAPPPPEPAPPSFMALDQKTGAVVWKNNEASKNIRVAQWTTPEWMENGAGQRRLVIAGGDAVLYCLDPASGKADWRVELDPDRTPKQFISFPAGKLCVWEDLIIQGLGHDDLSIKNYSVMAVTCDGKIAWRFTHPELKGCNSAVLVKDGIAFVLSNSAYLFSLDARSGALHTVHEMDDWAPFYMSPLLLGDRLLVPTQGGLFEYMADKSLTPTRYWDITCGSDITIDGDEIFWGRMPVLYCGEWERAK